MKFVMEFLTYQQLVRVSKQVINTYNNIALISPVLSHYKQTGRVMGSLDPRPYPRYTVDHCGHFEQVRQVISLDEI